MKQALPALFAAALMGIAGCVSVGPDYRPPAPETPEKWMTAVGAPDEAPVSWWTIFNDAALNELIDGMRINNRSLAAAVARMESYAALMGMAHADYFPSLAAGAGADRNLVTERLEVRNPARQELPGNPYWQYQGGFTMGWELDVWGRVRRGVEAARGQAEASLEDVRNLEVMLLAQVAGEYIRLRTLQQRLTYAEQNIKLQADTLGVVQDRFKAGLTGELDVRQAEMNLAATTSQVPLLKSELTGALNALCVLTGRLPGSLEHLRAAGLVPAASVLPGVLPAELLRRRPDIRSAERALAAQTAKIGMAKADFFPKLALNGTFSLVADNGGDFFSSAAQQYSFGPSLSWAVFTAGKVRSRVRAEEAATRAALAAYEQAVLAAYQDCEDSLVAFANERSRLSSLRAAVEAANKSVELVLELYRSGLVNFQNVLDAQRQLSQYQDAMAQSMGQSAKTLVMVYKAFGGGWDASAPGRAEVQ